LTTGTTPASNADSGPGATPDGIKAIGKAAGANEEGDAGRHIFVTETGRGPSVLFVHGQPGLGRDFNPATRLLDDSHRVLLPDRPGYGRTDQGPLSMAQNAELLAGLLLNRSAAPATVVGHSYGGGVAILLAAAHPELVSGLVLVGSVGRRESLNGLDHLLAAPVIGDSLSRACLFALGRILPVVRSAAGFVPRDVLERVSASLPDSGYLDRDSLRGGKLARSFVFEQRCLLKEIADVEASLDSVVVPTVVITGSWDVVVPPLVAAGISARIKGAELLTVEKVGHFVVRDAPGAVAEAVRSVESRSGPGRGGTA
jgi:pimeloyl-ACP methyl ester carboxylesterase